MISIQDRRHIKAELEQRKEAVKAAKEQLNTVVPVVNVPTNMRYLHWIVAGWINEHKRAQVRARSEAKNRKRHKWSEAELKEYEERFGWDLRGVPRDAELDLTERDKYRFRMTSAFLKGLEAQGGKALEGKISGELTVECSGQKITILVKEKMLQDRRKPSHRDKHWTAYLSHHNSALRPSGFLRVHSKTSVGGGLKDQWIETDTWNGAVFLASVISEVLAMGPILLRWEEEAVERRQQSLLEVQRRIEAQRLAQLEAERWEGFKQLSNDWDEARRLRRFLDELQSRPDEFAYEIEGMTISEYLAWARKKVDELDPFVLSPTHDPGVV